MRFFSHSMTFYLKATLCALGLCSLFSAGQAQSSTRMADLVQDVGLLTREVRALRLEVESLRSENATLRNRVASMDSVKAQLTVVNENLLTQVAGLEKKIAAGDAQTRNEVLTEVAEQIKALGEQTDRTLKSISDAINVQPTTVVSGPSIEFDDDYPQEAGVPYEVQSGDTLSGIAKKFDSRVSWIQKANKIADPKTVQVGRVLFIPQAE